MRLGEIYLSSGRASWARHLSPVGLAGVTSPPEDWERWISDPNVMVLVAERREQLAAVAVLCRSTDPDSDPALVAMLDRLYTEPASWRRGLGRSLLDAAMEELAGRQFREVTVWTAEWNTSRGFYETLGWELDGATREQTFAGGTFTEVRYRTAVPSQLPAAGDSAVAAVSSGVVPFPSTSS